jgi:phage-related protein
MDIQKEIKEITYFVHEAKTVSEIPEMQRQLDLAIGYSQRIGELLNEAERAYSIKKANCLNDLRNLEEETETTRKVKLESWVAEEKKLWRDLKNIQTHLRQRIMSLFQAIKTRREER